MSILDYGDIIYIHAAASTLKLLDAIVHCALRLITGDSYRTHHCVLYQKVGWASLYETNVTIDVIAVRRPLSSSCRVYTLLKKIKGTLK